MPLFEKAMEDAKSRGEKADIKETLAEQIKKRRLSELDETELETEEARQRAKLAEQQKREVDAQSSMMDKMMPQGMWGFMIEALKDKSPTSAITVQDMMGLVKMYVDQLGPTTQAQQPSEGMWGFLATVFSAMRESNKPMSVADVMSIAERFQKGEAAPPSAMSQAAEILGLLKGMKDIVSPPATPGAGTPSVPIDIGHGVAIPWEVLKEWQDHQFNLTLKREEHEEKKETGKALRENLPGALRILEAIVLKQAQPIQPPAGQQPPTQQQPTQEPSMFQVDCPECHHRHTFPAGTTSFKCESCGVESGIKEG